MKAEWTIWERVAEVDEDGNLKRSRFRRDLEPTASAWIDEYAFVSERIESALIHALEEPEHALAYVEIALEWSAILKRKILLAQDS